MVKAKHRETGMKFISSSFRNVCKAMYDFFFLCMMFTYESLNFCKDEINNRLWPKGITHSNLRSIKKC